LVKNVSAGANIGIWPEADNAKRKGTSSFITSKTVSSSNRNNFLAILNQLSLHHGITLLGP
jgi:hypothetical protein